MHIEKNICDNILVIIINLTSQSKDTLKARLNLHLMGIRSGLHPTKVDSSRTYISPACFILNVKEKHTFCKFLKGVKVLMAILQTISQCVNLKQYKISRFKSHDCYILMHQLMPVAIRSILPKHVSLPLIQFCSFFINLFFKVYGV